MTAVRVMIVNAQRGNPRRLALKAKILALNPAIILASEAQELGSLPGYHRAGAPDNAKWQARDCAIYARRRRFDLEDDDYQKMSEAVPGHPVQHERWIVWAKLRDRKTDKRFAPIALHGNAAIQGHYESRGAWESSFLFSGAMTVAGLLQHGRTVIVGGDWNVTTGTGWASAPDEIARRAGAKYRADHVDGVMIPGTWRFAKWSTYTAPGVAAPHRIIVTRIEST